MVNGINHVSIVVPDIEAAVRTLGEKYGLRVGERMLNAEQACGSPMSSLLAPRSS